MVTIGKGHSRSQPCILLKKQILKESPGVRMDRWNSSAGVSRWSSRSPCGVGTPTRGAPTAIAAELGLGTGHCRGGGAG